MHSRAISKISQFWGQGLHTKQNGVDIHLFEQKLAHSEELLPKGQMNAILPQNPQFFPEMGSQMLDKCREEIKLKLMSIWSWMETYQENVCHKKLSLFFLLFGEQGRKCWMVRKRKSNFYLNFYLVMNGKISARDLSQKVVLAFPFERRKFLSGAGQSLVVSSAVLPRQIEMIAAKALRLTDRSDFCW